MDILIDASAIMAVILNEANKPAVLKLTKNKTLLSPDVISYEIGNALINLYKKRKITEVKLLEAYNEFLSIPIRNAKIDIEKALKIACKYEIYAYDAYYLETAYRLKIPLLTFDDLMIKTGLKLRIDILDDTAEKEVNNESI